MEGISTGMYAVTVIGFMLWLTYGLLLGQWPLIATNAICLVLAMFILAMKLLPRRKRDAVADAIDPGKQGARGEVPPNAPRPGERG